MLKNRLLKIILATAFWRWSRWPAVCRAPSTTPTPAPASGGVVKGVVYADTNGNGVVDPGEGPLAGVQVSLAGCGALQNQVTAADGASISAGCRPAAARFRSQKPAGISRVPSPAWAIPCRWLRTRPCRPPSACHGAGLHVRSAATPRLPTTPAVLPTDTFTLTRHPHCDCHACPHCHIGRGHDHGQFGQCQLPLRSRDGFPVGGGPDGRTNRPDPGHDLRPELVADHQPVVARHAMLGGQFGDNHLW